MISFVCVRSRYCFHSSFAPTSRWNQLDITLSFMYSIHFMLCFHSSYVQPGNEIILISLSHSCTACISCFVFILHMSNQAMKSSWYHSLAVYIYSACFFNSFHKHQQVRPNKQVYRLIIEGYVVNVARFILIKILAANCNSSWNGKNRWRITVNNRPGRKIRHIYGRKRSNTGRLRTVLLPESRSVVYDRL
jgi:hypothetical protein